MRINKISKMIKEKNNIDENTRVKRCKTLVKNNKKLITNNQVDKNIINGPRQHNIPVSKLTNFNLYNSKLVFSLIILSSMFLILSLSLVSATGEVSSCCEKTKKGAWCLNAPQEECDVSGGLRVNPSSCDATSYCRMGFCYDSKEGVCMENTPQKVCEMQSGVWEEDTGETPSQCNLGCCLIGDQAAFVTQVRCKKLSSLYGLETNFRSDIGDEFSCIAQAQAKDKGACVFEKDFQKTCKFTTREDCNTIESASLGTTGNGTGVEFYKDFLCSAEELKTNCGPSVNTICIEGKDEVYFADTCGNQANIYDASKVKNTEYWKKIVGKVNSCGNGKDNAESASCGNCDYYLGSICKDYKSSDSKKPNYGNNICKNLDCEYEGETFKHGETWCAAAPGLNGNLPGSRYFRLVCYNNDVTVEPCADFRQQVCIQDELNGFRNAACRVNIWQDCFSQTKEKDCLNQDKRDCKWVEDIEFSTPSTTTQQGTLSNSGERFPVASSADNAARFPTGNVSASPPITGAIFGLGSITGDDEKKDNTDKAKGACVPESSPGFDFWQGGEASQLCALANKNCVVKYEKGLIGGKKCKENCECLEPGWADTQNQACVAIGDCGNKNNYLGYKSYGEGFKIIKNGNETK